MVKFEFQISYSFSYMEDGLEEDQTRDRNINQKDFHNQSEQVTAWTRAASLRGWREKDSVLWGYKKQTSGFDRMCAMGERDKRKKIP